VNAPDNPFLTEPVALLTWVAPWIVVVALAFAGREVLGRPLVWTEILALVGLVQGAAAGLARRQVLSPATATRVVQNALEQFPPNTTSQAQAIAKDMVKNA
jgi:hypothetical protein